MKRVLLFALGLMVCAAAQPRLLAQAPAAGSAKSPNNPAGNSQKPADSSVNPFPEDTTNVPVMPSKGTPLLPPGTYNGAESAPLPLPGDDLDPVRSPDDPAPETSNNGQDVNSSSSLKGLERLLPRPEDDQPEKKRKLLAKEPTHEEAGSKDIQVGDYYLETKNWKGALSRFESALVLDPENPEVYWGLAEAQHHMGDLANAKANYLKLLEYDPDGPHGKQARKELKDPAIEKAQAAKLAQSGEGQHQ
jgi:tetratricopeptide (TPR) repeat protein